MSEKGTFINSVLMYGELCVHLCAFKLLCVAKNGGKVAGIRQKEVTLGLGNNCTIKKYNKNVVPTRLAMKKWKLKNTTAVFLPRNNVQLLEIIHLPHCQQFSLQLLSTESQDNTIYKMICVCVFQVYM